MENIKPAVPKINEKSLKELSSQEFQQLLSSWFQEKGIIQDMRSYLKFQMINVLKNTAVGKNLTNPVHQTYSLAQQAVHLIVAEYLLQHQCHFTLSLFSNEVNLTTIFPQDRLLFCNNIKEAKNVFDKENLINILELIGISKDHEHFSKIVNQYFDDQMSSLLGCLIALVGKNIKEEHSSEQKCQADINFEDDFMENICKVLQSLNLSPKTLETRLLYNIKICYDLKTKSFKDQCIKLINKFKKELTVRDKIIRDGEKQTKSLENRLLKLQEENKSLKEKISSLLKDNEIVQHREDIFPACSLTHCGEKCNTTCRLYESCKKEIDVLRMENKDQKEEIERLNLNCNELLKEFNCCQNKINLVNTRLQEGSFDEANLIKTGSICKNTDNTSSDSDTTITEEILQQAREKLKLLEEESKDLDIRFSRCVNK